MRVDGYETSDAIEFITAHESSSKNVGTLIIRIDIGHLTTLGSYDFRTPREVNAMGPGKVTKLF